MTDLYNYFLEANLLLAAFAGIYICFLNNQSNFQFRRIFVLCSVICVLIIPLISIDLGHKTTTESIFYKTFKAITLPDLIVGNIDGIGTSPIQKANWPIWILFGYLSICVIFLFRFLVRLISILKILNNSKFKRSNLGTYTLIETTGKYPTFSFGRYLFLNTSIVVDKVDSNQIIAHEKVHIQHWHSLDVLLLEFMSTCFWANPAIWFFRNWQADNHEFIADEQVLQSYDINRYQELLIKMTVDQISLVGNYFAKIQTLKRINMMNEERRKTSKLKTGLAILSVVSITTFLACNDEILDAAQSAEMTLEIPENIKKVMAELKESHPDVNFIYSEVDLPIIETTNPDDPMLHAKATHNALNKIVSKMDGTVEYMEVLKEENKAGLVMIPTADFFKFAEYSKSDDDVYDLVEKAPEPKGGIAEFYKYIRENMKYPEQARRKGVEGKVFIQFVIDKQGNVTEVTTKKGIGSGCDLEAERVIKEAPAWTPGRMKGEAVKVRMILPITFSFGTDQKGKSMEKWQKTSHDIIEIDPLNNAVVDEEAK